MIDHLQERAESTGTSPERQWTLDARVKARINAELGRLREEENIVREQIEAALERENLSKEREGLDGDEAEGRFTSSSHIQGALDEVQKKVDRFHAKKDISSYPLVSESSRRLIECYRWVFVSGSGALTHFGVFEFFPTKISPKDSVGLLA